MSDNDRLLTLNEIICAFCTTVAKINCDKNDSYSCKIFATMKDTITKNIEPCIRAEYSGYLSSSEVEAKIQDVREEERRARQGRMPDEE
jgi:hypothetical protein